MEKYPLYCRFLFPLSSTYSTKKQVCACVDEGLPSERLMAFQRILFSMFSSTWFYATFWNIFKCFCGLIMDRKRTGAGRRTLPAVNRKFPTVEQQDQRWREEWRLYDLHNFSTFLFKVQWQELLLCSRFMLKNIHKGRWSFFLVHDRCKWEIVTWLLFDTNTMKYGIYVSSLKILLILFQMKWDWNNSYMKWAYKSCKTKASGKMSALCLTKTSEPDIYDWHVQRQQRLLTEINSFPIWRKKQHCG